MAKTRRDPDMVRPPPKRGNDKRIIEQEKTKTIGTFENFVKKAELFRFLIFRVNLEVTFRSILA